MMTLEQIAEWLKNKQLSYIAIDSTVPYYFVWRAKNKALKNPNYETVKKLSDYIEGKENDR